MPFGISSEGFDSWCLPEPIPEFALDGFDMAPFEFEGVAPFEFESAQTDGLNFKLDGMDDFIFKLDAWTDGLTQGFITTPTTDGGCSTALVSDEESSQPSTPHTPPGLFAPPGLAPPPGLELEEVAPAPKEATPEVEAVVLEPKEVAPVPKEATPVAEAAQKKGWTKDADDAAEVRKEAALEETRRISVMVQNVPKKCTRDLLAKVLDEAGFSGNYDLIYVVADLKQRNSGSGSALVNFNSEKACARFTKAFHKSAVAVAFPGFVGKKAIEVGPAPVQGLDANVRKLEKSSVLMSMLAERPGWQPARYNSAGHIEAEIGGS